MDRRLTWLLILSAVLTTTALIHGAEKADGTIKITRRSVSEAVGLSWGEGVLSYHGSDYAFTFNARGLLRGVDGRIAATELSGEVFNLKRVEDFAGTYQKVESDDPGGNFSRATIKNQNGVLVTLLSTIEGRKFNLGADGMEIVLKK
ncbi:MAG TPA: DUF1134 domain-containing protein [Candidatus Binatia bacterium]|jgi:hypothetical protein